MQENVKIYFKGFKIIRSDLKKYNPILLAVYSLIYDYSLRSGYCTLSNNSFAGMLNISTKTVRNTIKALSDFNFITIENGSNEHRKIYISYEYINMIYSEKYPDCEDEESEEEVLKSEEELPLSLIGIAPKKPKKRKRNDFKTLLTIDFKENVWDKYPPIKRGNKSKAFTQYELLIDSDREVLKRNIEEYVKIKSTEITYMRMLQNFILNGEYSDEFMSSLRSSLKPNIPDHRDFVNDPKKREEAYSQYVVAEYDSDNMEEYIKQQVIKNAAREERLKKMKINKK